MFSFHRHYSVLATTAAAILALSACGGGGGGGSPIPSSGGGAQTSPGAQKTGPASMVITIPPLAKQNTHFRPNYISAGTQSMTVGLVSGSTTTNLATVNLTEGSPNCSVPSGGGLQCTATVQAPFGVDDFAISTYSGINATGGVLSTGQVLETLTLNGTEPTVKLDLDGVPATVSLALGQSEFPVGEPASTSIIVQAYDSSNDLIIGPGLFANPITLAISNDPHGTLSVSYGPNQTNIASPGQVATLSYNGGSNVGSTITASGSGFSPASVTFNATGATITLFQYFDLANQVYMEPATVAPLPHGGAAVLGDFYQDFEGGFEAYGFGVATAAGGISKVYVGDTSDIYNPPETTPSYPGVTVVHGMSSSITYDELEPYDDVGVNPATGIVYYSGSTVTTSAPNCPSIEDESRTEQTGTIGAFNPATGTAAPEIILKGYPAAIKVDSAGNVWWIEDSGSCSESNLLGSDDYAIGELPAGSTTPIETTFSAAGITSIGDIYDMAITADGSTMYIADEDGGTNGYGQIIDVKLSAAPTAIVQVPLGSTGPYEPLNIAVSQTDGTVAWMGDNDPSDNYVFGYMPGSKPVSLANVSEGMFPVYDFYVYTSAYVDGSFWIGGSEYVGQGFGRVSGLNTNTPLANNYPLPSAEDEGETYVYSVSGGNGYVWGTDDLDENVYAVQYGVPSSGTVTFNSVHRLGTFMKFPKPRHVLKSHRHWKKVR